MSDKMKVVYKAIDSIKPFDKNPRRNDKAVAAVAQSIREYGFRQPIVIDSNGVIVVGHTRYRAALSLGMKELPVTVATELTPEQCKAYRLVDNKTGELAEWDEGLLAEQLKELEDIDLSMYGFEEEQPSATIPVMTLANFEPRDTVYVLLVAHIEDYAAVDKCLSELPQSVEVITRVLQDR